MSKTQILVVEDEAITAEVIAEQLEELGYTVTDTVTSATAAIASTAQMLPNLVLMDINLGRNEMDGISAAATIREQFKIPVIYLTAYSDDTTLERARITEPFGYIIKPFNERDLRVAIENALYKHSMERQLVEQKELLSTILRSTADAVTATNENGTITYMNPAAESLTGWPLVEASGHNITEVIRFVDERTGDPAENPALKVLDEGRVIYMDDYMALIAKDGTKTPVADSISPIFQETGSVTGVVLVLWNLSERRKAEYLAQEVTASREAEAKTQKLLAAEQELNELKSRLIATISHEYRTPLAIVQSSSEMLQRYGDRFSEQKKETYFNRIQSAVHRMTQLVSDVLTFSKAEAGEFSFNPVSLDVAMFCRDVVEEQQLIAGDRYRLNFIDRVFPISLSANLDEKILRHILTNLLTNAIKYSPNDSTINLFLLCENEQIIFQVQDQGIGIPSPDLQQLFEPFFRASNTGTIPGTGMGLSILKKCVDLHKGKITVSSEVGVGTTFTVKLPLG